MRRCQVQRQSSNCDIQNAPKPMLVHQTGLCRNDSLLKIALELERIATSDEYFIKRGLYPNVDFYSGITLRAMGIPVSMYTVLFAVARTVGWVSQWKEMAEDPVPRISRPRQVGLD